MSRLTTMILFISIILLLFHFGGMFGDASAVNCSDSTTFGSLNGYILNTLGATCPQNFGSSTMWTTIAGLGALALAGIIVGGILTKSLDLTLFAGGGIFLIGIFILIGWDLIFVFGKLREVNNMLAVMLISPMLIAYVLAIYDWARGRD